jgi:MFS transporter, PHS family, inorganic phosphate transporter
MMATVFLMQSLGQAFAATVSIIAIASVKDHFNNPTIAIDSMWRWIYGVGAIFPAIAMLLRMTIPESPRFTFDVLQNPKQASKDTKSMLNGFFTRRRASFHHNQPRNLENGHGTNTNNPAEPIDLPGFPPKKSWSDLSDYLITRGNWRYLLGTALTWFLMDFAFYGLGLNAPQIISIVWNGELAFKTQKPPSWFSDPEPLQPGQLPYGNFRHNATHTLIIVSIGAISGSLILIWLVNHISRKRLMVLGFLVLAVLLFVIGGIFSSSMYSEGSQILVAALYGLCQFLFNLGPNGLTFLVCHISPFLPFPISSNMITKVPRRNLPDKIQMHNVWHIGRLR